MFGMMALVRLGLVLAALGGYAVRTVELRPETTGVRAEPGAQDDDSVADTEEERPAALLAWTQGDCPSNCPPGPWPPHSATAAVLAASFGGVMDEGEVAPVPESLPDDPGASAVDPTGGTGLIGIPLVPAAPGLVTPSVVH